MIERDLRDTLRSRAEAMPLGRADEHGLARRLAAARRRRTQARLAAGAAALVVLLGGAALVSADDGTPSNVVAGPDPSSTTTAPVPSTTTAPVAPEETGPQLPAPVPTSAVPRSVPPGPSTTATRRPTTSAAPIPPLPAEALWPTRLLAKRFFAPDRAVDDFARNFLLMGTPVLGPPQVTGSEARVEVRPLPTAGLTTVVTLRRFPHWGWVVVGCAAPTIQIDQPGTGATVDSPLTVRGRARTFEGHVQLRLLFDPAHTIADASGTAGGDEIRPFETAMTFPAAAIRDAQNGVPIPVMLVASEPRADDGSQGPAAATVVRLMI